ncbi:hypothetical protein JANAI62_20030 [Jannaschia pagri]|uniref:Uncharacterized protein n=1 Tax=Jannaschia pagri TaxID=2829797 RepID=A0ABQ4NLT8_9RHOB|nr:MULTISPECIES: hypothetical protein [unclassified Jannaschia]GIT91546.1 hypothetical protein JANAI61_20040 [Jannaschia sp. AI_61]GIT95380.1 hypothetical protein JANAI62_20030 [Jannaschia sp. AI_62]
MVRAYDIYRRTSALRIIAFGLRSSKLSQADEIRRIEEVVGIFDMIVLQNR